MGDMADAIINGDDCEGCGEYLGEGDGYPRRCSSCGGGGGDYDAQDNDRKSRKALLEPQRIQYAQKKLVDYDIKVEGDRIFVKLKHGTITFFPFTGWFQGQKPYGSMKGRGIANFVEELKKITLPDEEIV